jgi:hypothetical protein
LFLENVILILLGALAIFYVAEPLFNRLVAPHVYFQVTASDWQGVATIWTAEVPLAFLLRFLFGDNNMNAAEYDLNMRQSLQLARDMEGKKDLPGVNPYAHLKIYRAKRNWPRGPLAYVINTKRIPPKAFPINAYIWALQRAGLVEEPKDFDTIRDMRNRLEKDGAPILKKVVMRADLDI